MYRLKLAIFILERRPPLKLLQISTGRPSTIVNGLRRTSTTGPEASGAGQHGVSGAGAAAETTTGTGQQLFLMAKEVSDVQRAVLQVLSCPVEYGYYFVILALP